jgi:acyl carrier protein
MVHGSAAVPEGLEKIFASKKAITPDMRLDDVGNVDSVAMLEVQALADEEFGVMLEPSDIATARRWPTYAGS